MNAMEDSLEGPQNVVTEFKAFHEKIDRNQRDTLLRLEALQREMVLRFANVNQRFDDLAQRLNLERRVDNLERELAQRRSMKLPVGGKDERNL
jgi:hypothetical protein